jgi:hypothetical protein
MAGQMWGAAVVCHSAASQVSGKPARNTATVRRSSSHDTQSRTPAVPVQNHLRYAPVAIAVLLTTTSSSLPAGQVLVQWVLPNNNNIIILIILILYCASLRFYYYLLPHGKTPPLRHAGPAAQHTCTSHPMPFLVPIHPTDCPSPIRTHLPA